MGATAAIIGAITSAAGAGIAAHASYKQGRTAEALAGYNAHQQLFNAQMQLMAAEAQAKLQKRVAEANYRLRQNEANARFANAAMIEQTAEAHSRVTREEIRRKRTEFERGTGTIRAAIGHSNLMETSETFLQVLGEAKAAEQTDADESLYTDALNRRSLFREADMERFGGRSILAGALVERGTALAEAGLGGAIGRMDYRRAMREAEFTRLSGAAQRQSYRAQGTGTLISGIAGAFGSLAKV
jgi:hypothetical protein